MEQFTYMTTQEILNDEFGKLQQDLIDKYNSLGMRSSGNWANELAYETTEHSATLWGASYTEQLINGRSPGKQPPRQDIEQWIISKGIQPLNAKMSISSLAFLIARKIAREGTKYFKQGGTDLISAILTAERVQSILDRVTEFNVSAFSTRIEAILKDISNGNK